MRYLQSLIVCVGTFVMICIALSQGTTAQNRLYLRFSDTVDASLSNATGLRIKWDINNKYRVLGTSALEKRTAHNFGGLVSEAMAVIDPAALTPVLHDHTALTMLDSGETLSRDFDINPNNNDAGLAGYVKVNTPSTQIYGMSVIPTSQFLGGGLKRLFNMPHRLQWGKSIVFLNSPFANSWIVAFDSRDVSTTPPGPLQIGLCSINATTFAINWDFVINTNLGAGVDCEALDLIRDALTGNYIIVGKATNISTGLRQGLVACVTPGGVVTYTKTYPSIGGTGSEFTSINQVSSMTGNEYIITGNWNTPPTTSQHGILALSLDPSGTINWQQYVNSQTTSADLVSSRHCLAFDYDIAVAGSIIDNASGTQDAYILKFQNQTYHPYNNDCDHWITGSKSYQTILPTYGHVQSSLADIVWKVGGNKGEELAAVGTAQAVHNFGKPSPSNPLLVNDLI